MNKGMRTDESEHSSKLKSQYEEKNSHKTHALHTLFQFLFIMSRGCKTGQYGHAPFTPE